jgi:xanthine dehydrogenase YagR molybdenum-binding subunit
VRRGRFLIGIGMAAATRGNFLRPSKCKVLLDRDGFLVARMSMTDIGTGSYTIFTQIAAEMLGLPANRVRIEIGDSDFPETAGSGGSFGAASAGSALFDACDKLRVGIVTAAGMSLGEARFFDGKVAAAGRTVILSRLAADTRLEADGEIKPGEMTKKYSQQSYGAHFVEIGVDMASGEARLMRMLGVFAAGRILNMKTATSQAIGGMIWGVGAALAEEGLVDPRFGCFANHDLAEYHVPAHADIPAIEAHFLSEIDDKTNPLKIKGVGELGTCASGAAVVNAIYNACGVRVRDYPATLDKLLGGLGRAA